jgi:hypothetical protein
MSEAMSELDWFGVIVIVATLLTILALWLSEDCDC